MNEGGKAEGKKQKTAICGQHQTDPNLRPHQTLDRAQLSSNINNWKKQTVVNTLLILPPKYSTKRHIPVASFCCEPTMLPDSLAGRAENCSGASTGVEMLQMMAKCH